LCERRLSSFFSNEKYGEFCNAKLDFVGLLLPLGGEPQRGMLCKLPIEFEIVKIEDQ
jgi:hypothetical protein